MEREFKCELSSKKSMLKDLLGAFMTERMETVMSADTMTGEEDGDAISEDSDSDSDDDDDDDNNDAALRPSKRANQQSKGGFQACVQLSTELSDFLGEVTMPRTQVTKRVWEYIKAHNLQNPDDKRYMRIFPVNFIVVLDQLYAVHVIRQGNIM
jgi:chromatin remodeling complex protein RSC6